MYVCTYVCTLRSLIDEECGIVEGGLEKKSKTNSQGGWNSREAGGRGGGGVWKNLEYLIA